jgi:hypothetical protein
LHRLKEWRDPVFLGPATTLSPQLREWVDHLHSALDPMERLVARSIGTESDHPSKREREAQVALVSEPREGEVPVRAPAVALVRVALELGVGVEAPVEEPRERLVAAAVRVSRASRSGRSVKNSRCARHRALVAFRFRAVTARLSSAFDRARR